MFLWAASQRDWEEITQHSTNWGYWKICKYEGEIKWLSVQLDIDKPKK